jgi:hypothetical protein
MQKYYRRQNALLEFYEEEMLVAACTREGGGRCVQLVRPLGGSDARVYMHVHNGSPASRPSAPAYPTDRPAD